MKGSDQQANHCILLARGCVALLFSLLMGTAHVAAAPPVEVMILGAFHMANPGKDVHNVDVDDVTTEARQAQLKAVSEALQAFAPTKVAVEHDSDRENLTVAAYGEFKPADLKEKPNETVQLGFRLAHDLGFDAVYGIDEKSDAIDYFPYGELQAYAQEHEGKERLEELNAQAAAYVAGMGRAQSNKTVAEVLMWINRPGLIERMHRNWYYGLMEIGDGERQPGALVNARYYLRNARIFAKLTTITGPGDRIVIVFGSGHAYWLRHFVRETPGYELVEPNDFLAAAASP